MKNVKITKLASLLLALAMLFLLASCSSSSSSSSDSATEDSSVTAAPVEEEETEDAAETDSLETEDLGDPVTLTAATSFNESDALGSYWVYFKNYVEEASGGNITIDLYSSGSLGGADEYLSMMKDNVLDLCGNYAPYNAFLTPAYVTVLNGMNSVEEALDYAKYIAFENEESAAIFEAEAAEYNATLLGGVMSTGFHAFVSTKEVSSLTDMMENCKLGSVSESSYSAMGFQNFVTIDGSDLYESLRTGVCDCLDYDSATIMSQKLYELAESVIIWKAYPVLDFYCVNTTTWNSLTEAQQAILAEASDATMQYAIDYVNEQQDLFVSTFEENGATVIEMTEDEFNEITTIDITTNYSSMLSGLGSATGKTDDLVPCVKAGLTWYMEHCDFDFGDVDEFVENALSTAE